MEIKWKILSFDNLSVNDLYQILQLRTEIFVVEQNCVFQDMDFKDQKALHLLGKLNDRIVAYSRLFAAGDYYNLASIGRVVVQSDFRIQKLGHQLLQESKKEVLKNFNTTKIKIGAQLYLKKFYESHGFVQSGPIYLEDNIEHIEMIAE